MKVRGDAEIAVVSNKPYLKIGMDIFKLDGLDSTKILEFWNVLIGKEKTIIQTSDLKLYNDFCAFLRMKGVIYDDDIWDAYFQQHGISLKNAQFQMKKTRVLVLGNQDLCEEAIGCLSEYFECTNDKNVKSEYAIIIGRKTDEIELLEANEYAFRHVKVYFPVLIEPFKVECGPMVLPNETPCLQCLYNKIHKNTLFPKEREGFNNIEARERTRLFEPVYSIGIQVVLIQLIKRWLFDNGVPIEQELQNVVWEYSFLESQIAQHNIIRDRDCALCFPSKNANDINVWNVKI